MAAAAGVEERVAKVRWLAQVSGVEPHHATVGAAAAGDWWLLRYLLECGCPFGAKDLAVALRHVQLGVADWLVVKVGCNLEQTRVYGWKVAAASGNVGPTRWLLGRGWTLPGGVQECHLGGGSR